MASRKLLRRVDKRITELGGVLGQSGEEWFLSRVSDGDPMGQIAEEVGLCSRAYMYVWMKSKGEEFGARYAEAKRRSAEAYAEEGMRILDKLDGKAGLENVDVTLADRRAAYRRWMAKHRDPEQFGEKGARVEVSIGTLHLDALRAAGSAKALAPAEAPEAEWEFEDDEELAEDVA